MQISQSVHAGDLVEIRRRRWRVLDVRAYDGCVLLTVAGLDPRNHGGERRFLTPFDAVTALDRLPAPRFVRSRRWRRACRALIASVTPAGSLRAAGPARIDLMPYQIEPALAVVRGLGSRVLLADAVGLGKTIQAGLILAELRARGLAERFLVVTPAGLRDQWRGELSEHFGIESTLVDFREIRRRTATRAIGLNPWITTPAAIASIDYLKRPDVLQAARACRWDVVIVDEAHGAATASDRHAAVSALASRAAHVLLLTATPHNGDARAFASLCSIGALDDPLIVFRRTRQDVKVGTVRRVHLLGVRSSPAEARMHALLARFTSAVRAEHDSADAWLALSVLHKRACSSPRALELTIDRRLASLGPADAGGLRQPPLPLGSPGEFDDADEAPDCLAAIALRDERREHALLRALRDAARRAIAGETKIAAIRRLLERAAEPAVIFTEYRDTLQHLRASLGRPALSLHGGMTRDERTAVVADFATGPHRVLLATDAAGEGLNLHHRCRVVINLELPWNPVRLEQRIGRVDRIGQRRTVHAFHLIGRDTGESRVLRRLQARIARAGRAVAASDPFAGEERSVARMVIDPGAGDIQDTEAAEDAPSIPTTVDLGADARLEVSRLSLTRGCSDGADAIALSALETTAPWLARIERRRLRLALPRHGIALLRIDYEDGTGRSVDALLVPLLLSLGSGSPLDARGLKAFLDAVSGRLRVNADEAGRSYLERFAPTLGQLAATRLHREERIAHAVGGPPRLVVQPGLFDRRAERAVLVERDTAGATARDSAADVALAARQRVVRPRPARLLLLLMP